MLKTLSPMKKAYVAGFLDGDGSVYVQAKPNNSYRFRLQVAPYVVLYQSQKSEKLFRELCELIGYGHIRTRNDGILECIINRIDELKEFLSCVRPFVMLKRKQVELMLDILSLKERVETKEDFVALLTLIEKFRALNYSKRRKQRTVTP